MKKQANRIERSVNMYMKVKGKGVFGVFSALLLGCPPECGGVIVGWHEFMVVLILWDL